LIDVLQGYLDSINDEYEYFCCYGYCIDLLKELSKNLSFVYTLHLVGDNKYGSYEKVNKIFRISRINKSCFRKEMININDGME
jgi:hypothetical protein